MAKTRGICCLTSVDTAQVRLHTTHLIYRHGRVKGPNLPDNKERRLTFSGSRLSAMMLTQNGMMDAPLSMGSANEEMGMGFRGM
jgi:hypothetical protein